MSDEAQSGSLSISVGQLKEKPNVKENQASPQAAEADLDGLGGHGERSADEVMHWTLQTLLWLCGACALLNAVQYALVGSVRTIGILICAAWGIQQLYWWEHHSDSLTLFIACDAAIIGWFLYLPRAFDLRERIIAASIPITTAIGISGRLAGGLTESWWWLNISIVAAQMIIGLPWPKFQRLGGVVSHGPMRPKPEHSYGGH